MLPAKSPSARKGSPRPYYRAFIQISPEDTGEEFEPQRDWREKLIPPWIEAAP